MVNISLRGVDEQVQDRLKAVASRSGMSVNALILDYIHRGVGLDPTRRSRHTDLDKLAATWSQNEYDEFMDATSHFDTIDHELWK